MGGNPSAPQPVSVVGGAGGITARTDELTELARRFGALAVDCLGSAATLHGYLVDPAISASALFDPAGWARFEVDLVDALDGPHGLTWVGARCGVLDGELRAAATAYRGADRLASVVHDELTGLLTFPGAVFTAGSALVRTHDLGTAAQAGLAADPELADVVVNGLAVPGVLSVIDPALPDGHGVAHSLGRDMGGTSTRPPRRLTDVLSGLARRNDDPHHGAVDVRILTLPDGTRRAIVDITGTKSWSAGPTGDITSLSTNARALAGESTAYEQGVLAAMQRAGVGPHDDVMLVGHSEGGMVAVTTARDAVRSGRFHVTHVVTAGSPIARSVGDLPASVEVLALENSRDVVPHLDGEANPDLRNVTTAGSAHGDGTVVGDHGIETSYLPVARDVQSSNAASIRDFLAGAEGYFRATAVTTHTFQIVRHY